ncbi:MAG: radical SAM protein [Myxococcota bacterium]|jgi:2-iminoacetate synthase|nr:radical SAM protein [Myxococcota bacterium]
MNDLARLIDACDEAPARQALACQDRGLVRPILRRRPRGLRDMALLLSPAAGGLLDEMAVVAAKHTLERFGKARQLYAPLYVSNYCSGSCPYCGFGKQEGLVRRRLSADEVVDEAMVLRSLGMRHLLLVSGDDPVMADERFLAEVASKLRPSFSSLSVEVPSLPSQGYETLVAAGVDGVTLYQETYDRDAYEKYHCLGPKRDYDDRLHALSRAGQAGVYRLTAGVLLGLSPLALEALRLMAHIGYLQRTSWRSFVGVGVPRLRSVPAGFEVPHPVSDRDLVQLMLALRIAYPDLGITLSTRENPLMRDRLSLVAATQLSAGSRTEPGGYRAPGAAADQFRIFDERSPEQVAQSLQRQGLDPVWKDWDSCFLGESTWRKPTGL